MIEMNQAIYKTLKAAIRMKIEDIHKTNRYYEDSPEEAVFDLNAETRKTELAQCFEAEEWLIAQKKAGLGN